MAAPSPDAPQMKPLHQHTLRAILFGEPGKPRSLSDKITIFTMVLFLFCLSWEIWHLGSSARVTYSEVFRRLNFASGGLLVLFLLAFVVHATIPFPLTWHNTEAYEKAWQSTPAIEQND